MGDPIPTIPRELIPPLPEEGPGKPKSYLGEKKKQ
jgi:hypothetical protein